MAEHEDLVEVAGNLVLLMPTSELRFIERDGKHILQQKWSAARRERFFNREEKRWRWRDVPFDANPERDS